MRLSISLNKKIEANQLIKHIDSYIKKYAIENKGLDNCLLVVDIVKISDQESVKLNIESKI